MSMENLIQKAAAIQNKDGLHVRTAVVVARLAKTAKGAIFFEKEGLRVPADSVTELLLLNCQKNDLISLIATHAEDEPLLVKIKELLALDEIPL